VVSSSIPFNCVYRSGCLQFTTIHEIYLNVIITLY
jgi:hypothetical protein